MEASGHNRSIHLVIVLLDQGGGELGNSGSFLLGLRMLTIGCHWNGEIKKWKGLEV